MLLRSLEVRDFRIVQHAKLEFGRGLNVLYGPNELGKSTLVEALRAAFLLPVGSKTAEELVPWGTDRAPQVTVEFELPAGSDVEGKSSPTSSQPDDGRLGTSRRRSARRCRAGAR